MADLPEGLTLIDPVPELPPGLMPVKEGEIETISSGLPVLERIDKKPLDRPGITYYPGMTGITQEGDFSYRQRASDYYGFDAVPDIHRENYDKLEEAAGFLPSRDPKHLQKIADKAFDGKAKVKIHQEFGEPVLEFDTGEIVPFEEAGIGMQTVRGARFATGEIAAEAAGGLAGLPGGVPGVVTGVGAGIFTANYAGYKNVNDSFDLGMNEAEMLGSAAINTAISMGLEIGTLGAGAIVRRMIMNPVAKKVVGDLSEEQITAAIRAAEEHLAETGTELMAGQALQKARKEGAEIAKQDIEEMRTLEEGLSTMEQETRRIIREQDIAAQKATKEVTEKVERDVTEEEMGAEAIEAARRDVSIQREQLESQLDIERSDVDAAIGEILPPSDTFRTTDDVRKYLVDAADETVEQHRAKYRALWEDVPEGTTVDVAPVRKSAAKISKTIESDLFPHLTEESRPIIKEAMELGAKEGEDVIANIESVSRAISQLKNERRMMEAGTVPDRAKNVLNKVISDLSEARRKALADIDPELRARLDLLDEQYSVISEEIYGNIVGKLIARNKQGAFKVADDRLLTTLMASPQEMRRIANMIKDPEFGGFGQTEALKDGIRQLYRDQVVNRNTTHKAFMNKYGASIDEVFTPKEKSRIFRSLEGFAKEQYRLDQRERLLRGKLEKSFEGKLEDMTPDGVFNFVMGGKDQTSKIRQLKRMMTEDEFEGFKSVYARDFLNKMKEDVGFGEEFSSSRLNKVLKENSGELETVFGKEYVNDLKWLRDMTDATKPLPAAKGRAKEILDQMGEASPLRLFLRSTLFRPLSREGVFFSGVIKTSRRAARKAADKIVSDPKLLRTAHELYVKDAPLRKWRSFFRTMGYDELADQLFEEE